MAGRKRHDPVSRDVDGRVSYETILNKDPERHYALVNPNDETGLNYYLARGYEVEIKRPDGPRPTLSKVVADGDEHRPGGQVLVSRPMVEHEAEYARLSSISAQIERKILKDENLQDGLRGRGVVSRPMWGPAPDPEQLAE